MINKLLLNKKYMAISFCLFRFYVGNHIHILDRGMREIKMPYLIRRNFRPLSERDYYHAYEWKFILLFAAYPVLKGILPERYLTKNVYQL